MYSGRISFTILLSVLFLVGQWPLSVMAESLPDDRQAHCHVRADSGQRSSADHAGATCHQDGNSAHCAQVCDCLAACGGCAATSAAVALERLQFDHPRAPAPVPSLSDGLTSRPISPLVRPPRFLLD